MRSYTLPTELLTSIFGRLSPSDLARASGVCRTWKTVAFSPLYQTVYLCLADHLEQFVERVRTETEKSQFSVVTHLQGLVLDIEYWEDTTKDTISEADIGSLNTIIPKLANLRHFSWNLMFLPEDPETFRLFQTECPRLDSVHIWIKDSIDFFGTEYELLFDFKDLSHFSLSIWDGAIAFDEDDHDPLPLLLSRCPNLSTLALDICGEFAYSPSILAAKIGDGCVFPRLRRFYARDNEDPNWTQFFTDPESNPFRQFISRHPRIEDLALGYAEESLHYGEINPTEFAQLFPSLKYFEGPVFLCLPLVLSPLTEQIETLIVVDKRLAYDEVSLSKMYDNVPTLPKLRKFGFWSEEIDYDIMVSILRTIVNAASQLEEIEIHSDIESANYEEVMGLITQVHGLRSITLNESILNIAAEKDGKQGLDWNTFASDLRRTCSKLRTIYQPIRKFDKENRQRVWKLPETA